MQLPFSITLFATTGNPQGIRHIDKSNWSGFGVVFPKELLKDLKSEPTFAQAGIYILVGNAAEETIYIGEADPVGDRLKNHAANKEGWVWGVYFVDKNHKIGKTEVQFIEAELIKLAKQHNRSILLNKNNSTSPSMSPIAKASAQAFLVDMLLILPMLGINAFTPLTLNQRQEIDESIKEESDPFDTLIVPAQEAGFQESFINNKCWYAVRINSKHKDKIKYIAAYRVKPISAITHIAEVAEILPYQNTGKYLLRFKEDAIPIKNVPRGSNSTISMQSIRYGLKEKILAATFLDDVWE